MERFPVAPPQVDLNDGLTLDAHTGEPADLGAERYAFLAVIAAFA
jgi:hypothetical protein